MLKKIMKFINVVMIVLILFSSTPVQAGNIQPVGDDAMPPTPQAGLEGENQVAPDTVVPTEVTPDTVLPTAIPIDTAIPTEVPVDTVLPTAIPTDTAMPTAVPTDTAVPSEVPTDTAVPAAIPTDTAVPTAVPKDTAVPALVPLSAGFTILSSAVTSLSVGSEDNCVVMNGGMKCWGRNDLGQLGNGSVTNSSVPVTVLNAEGSAALSGVSTASSSYHTCAVMGDSGAMCWGNNYWGQLGSPDLDQSWLPTDVLVSSGGSRLTNVTAIKTISGYTTCALMSDSGVKCWGKNYYGQLGNGTGGAGLKSMVPVDVLTGGAVD